MADRAAFFEVLHPLFRFNHLVIGRDVPVTPMKILDGWPTDDQIALVFTAEELDDNAVLARILAILETSEKAKATAVLGVDDPLRAIAQVKYIARDTVRHSLALVFAGESLGSVAAILRSDGLDDAESLWQFVAEVAFELHRAWFSGGVLIAPVELSRCFLYSDPQRRVQVKIIAQIALKPTNSDPLVLSYIDQPAESGHEGGTKQDPQGHLTSTLLELLCQFLRLCRVDQSSARHLIGYPDDGNMLRNVLGNDDQTWREVLGWFQQLEFMLLAWAKGKQVDIKHLKRLFWVDPVDRCFDALKVPLSWTN